jgi:hypothetical protein
MKNFQVLGKLFFQNYFYTKKMGMTKRYLVCWRVAADNKIA